MCSPGMNDQLEGIVVLLLAWDVVALAYCYIVEVEPLMLAREGIEQLMCEEGLSLKKVSIV